MEADLRAVVAWADQAGHRWAFTLSNAGAYYAEFRASLNHLNEVDWNAVGATDFRRSTVKEGKQAEFLVHGGFPWRLVSQIGVASPAIATQVSTALQAAPHRPRVAVQPTWYF